MNILPKKRWHVRTRDNINRVRRDEAQAADEAKAREQRMLLAEQEARTTLMRARARARLTDEQRALAGPAEAPVSVTPAQGQPQDQPLAHVNFFSDLEAGETTRNTNQEREADQKREQEEYEKKVGILTYLGQDSQELSGQKAWWASLPDSRSGVELDEAQTLAQTAQCDKFKGLQDPLNDIRRYLGCSGVQKYMRAPAQPDSAGLETSRKRSRHASSSTSDESDDETQGRRKSSTHPKKKKKKEKRHKKRSSSQSRKAKKSRPSSGQKKKKKKKEKRKQTSSAASASDSNPCDESIEEKERKLKMDKMEKLRIERLDREKRERAKANKLLAVEPPSGTQAPTDDLHGSRPPVARKYNSQFNPDAARQNKLDAKQKYWLD